MLSRFVAKHLPFAMETLRFAQSDISSEYRCYIRMWRLANRGAGDQFIEQFDERVRVGSVAKGRDRVDGLRQVEAR
jgi:hypothetical protein